MMNESALREILANPDYQVLTRVPTTYTAQIGVESKRFIATIIDLETMGLDPKQHEIIEIGLLSFSFSNEAGILAVVNSYNELNDPGRPIPPEVSKVTGISNEDVKGKVIDWNLVQELLKDTNLIICHQSKFDRNVLELQTPPVIQGLMQSMPFACTINDIDWKERGFESSKLDYLNWKLGFFYDGHRAINDCWATFNLLLQEEGAFDELKKNVRKRESIICAVNTHYDKRELLKNRDYRWSPGDESLPKCWWTCIPKERLADEKQWLDTEIYGKSGMSDTLPTNEITARKRYSYRAHAFES